MKISNKNNEIVKFDDLEFIHYDCGIDRAYIKFNDKISLSVITGSLVNCDEDRPYEVAVLVNGNVKQTTFTNEHKVLSYQTKTDVEKILENISMFCINNNM